MTYNPHEFGHRDPEQWPVTPGGFRNAYDALGQALYLMNWASQFIRPETLAFRHALWLDDENPELDEQLQDDIELLFKLGVDLAGELDDVLSKMRREGPSGRAS